MARLVRTAEYDVRDFASTEEFLEILDSEMPDDVAPDCVVIDVGSPGLSCEELAEELKAGQVLAPIIVVTANEDPKTRQIAKELNAIGFFRKPVDGMALLDAISWALTIHGGEVEDM